VSLEWFSWRRLLRVWNGRAANKRKSTSAILVVSIAMWFDVLCCRGGDLLSSLTWKLTVRI
jgi:hypothetical protein